MLGLIPTTAMNAEDQGREGTMFHLYNPLVTKLQILSTLITVQGLDMILSF